MKRYIKWFAITIIIGMLSACSRTAPVQQISTTVSAAHTQEQVKNAILKAGAQRDWIMTQVSPGVIKARYQSQNHVAEVRITYTATSYNINYDSSLNLQASNGKVHKNYNRWVRNLDKDIRVNLSTAATL
ncbi:hypothetical protein PT300_07570 [Enterobacteriaceae bacterium ESL0689]|nr:hypothetical protein [Enterobacteriaceae bacterium ESL0689]